MTTQIGLEAWEDFARIAGVELLVIDESTTLRGFESDIRSNAAYYRLSQGL
jgi:L-arabinose isomerase